MTYEEQVLSIVLAKLQRANRHAEKWGGRSEADFVFICSDFADILSARHAPIAEIAKAFDAHFEANSRKFPCIEDILAYWATETAYQMNNGPLGWGGLYSADHPYVRQQLRLGTDIGAYQVTVTAREHAGLRTAAACAVMEFDPGNDEMPRIERAGSGLRKLSYDA